LERGTAGWYNVRTGKIAVNTEVLRKAYPYEILTHEIAHAADKELRSWALFVKYPAYHSLSFKSVVEKMGLKAEWIPTKGRQPTVGYAETIPTSEFYRNLQEYIRQRVQRVKATDIKPSKQLTTITPSGEITKQAEKTIPMRIGIESPILKPAVEELAKVEYQRLAESKQIFKPTQIFKPSQMFKPYQIFKPKTEQIIRPEQIQTPGIKVRTETGTETRVKQLQSQFQEQIPMQMQRQMQQQMQATISTTITPVPPTPTEVGIIFGPYLYKPIRRKPKKIKKGKIPKRGFRYTPGAAALIMGLKGPRTPSVLGKGLPYTGFEVRLMPKRFKWPKTI
jgi:hypothetical protein